MSLVLNRDAVPFFGFAVIGPDNVSEGKYYGRGLCEYTGTWDDLKG